MSELVQLRARAAPPVGFALFDKGFRPFFLLAALFAVLGVPAWIGVRRGLGTLGEHFLPTVWHGHEMVFGFAAAVIGGFLLTAAGNWTQRETAVGPWLAGLCAVWLAGRVTLLLGGHLDGRVIAIVNLAFLPLLAFAVGRPIIQARSRRNYGIVALLALLFGAQALTHAGALTGSIAWQTLGPRLGVDLVIVIVLVIGGRVIPMFTRNATGAEVRSLPWLDRVSIASAVAIVVLDGLRVSGSTLGVVLVVAALTALARTRHWGAARSFGEPLLWALHVGYLFVPIGFALRAASAWTPAVDPSTAMHALTVGAIGSLVLGMMARVSLGHTGRPLVGGRWLGVAFGLVALAAVVRVVGPLVRLHTLSVDVSAAAFALAFAIYLARVGPSLFVSRPDGKPG